MAPCPLSRALTYRAVLTQTILLSVFRSSAHKRGIWGITNGRTQFVRSRDLRFSPGLSREAALQVLQMLSRSAALRPRPRLHLCLHRYSVGAIW